MGWITKHTPFAAAMVAASLASHLAVFQHEDNRFAPILNAQAEVTTDDWGPFVGPWRRYEQNPVIRLEGKETYSIQNGPQTVIRWKGTWTMFLMTSQPMVTKLAVSDDGLVWKRPHHDYLLKPEIPWEGSYNLAKAAVVSGDEVWLYYFGKKGKREIIGLAFANGEGTGP